MFVHLGLNEADTMKSSSVLIYSNVKDVIIKLIHKAATKCQSLALPVKQHVLSDDCLHEDVQ